jgi:DNA-binding transcriptional ArsR family regulator
VFGTDLAAIARLIANPTCAGVLDALLADRALSVSALAAEIGAGRSTVSEAVGSLDAAGLVVRRREGRSSMVRLAGDDVADALEALQRLTGPQRQVGLRAVTRMEALRRGRTCYDHLAGELGIAVAQTLFGSGVLTPDPDDGWRLSDSGRNRLVACGIDAALVAPGGRRPLVRTCLDWTEHRPHVAGRVGAAICTHWLERGIVVRRPDSRALAWTDGADAWLATLAAGERFTALHTAYTHDV